MKKLALLAALAMGTPYSARAVEVEATKPAVVQSVDNIRQLVSDSYCNRKLPDGRTIGAIHALVMKTDWGIYGVVRDPRNRATSQVAITEYAVGVQVLRGQMKFTDLVEPVNITNTDVRDVRNVPMSERGVAIFVNHGNDDFLSNTLDYVVISPGHLYRKNDIDPEDHRFIQQQVEYALGSFEIAVGKECERRAAKHRKAKPYMAEKSRSLKIREGMPFKHMKRRPK